MPEHVVEQGEHLTRIAEKHGFADPRKIWDHPENADLKARRPNINVLFPGDVLFIPDREPKAEILPTGILHRFLRLALPNVTLRLKVDDLHGRPLGNASYTLQLEGGSAFEGSTDGDGTLEHDIPLDAQEGTCTLAESESEFNLEIGFLDPVVERSGQVARLHNLGYGAGVLSGEDDPHFRLAVEEFQLENGLGVDGICGEKTQAKLVEIHGS